jgi:hypothetical protein
MHAFGRGDRPARSGQVHREVLASLFGAYDEQVVLLDQGMLDRRFSFTRRA